VRLSCDCGFWWRRKEEKLTAYVTSSPEPNNRSPLNVQAADLWDDQEAVRSSSSLSNSSARRELTVSSLHSSKRSSRDTTSPSRRTSRFVRAFPASLTPLRPSSVVSSPPFPFHSRLYRIALPTATLFGGSCTIRYAKSSVRSLSCVGFAERLEADRLVGARWKGVALGSGRREVGVERW
jgi:hypothetical protein